MNVRRRFFLSVCVAAVALAACTATLPTLSQPFPERYIAELTLVTQGRQALAAGVLAGTWSADKALAELARLDKLAAKVALARLVELNPTAAPADVARMDAALAEDARVRAAVVQALGTIAPPVAAPGSKA